MTDLAKLHAAQDAVCRAVNMRIDQDLLAEADKLDDALDILNRIEHVLDQRENG